MGTDIHLRVQRSGVTIKNLLTGEEKLRTWVDVDNMEAFEPDPMRVWLDAFDAERAKYKPADAPADFRLLPEEHRACCDAAERAKDALGDGDPTERNYLLFARLFDVRNGRGFAGCETHRPIESLFAGRGLPDDDAARRFDPDSRDETSVWTDEELERSYLGDHSFTHATLAELLRTVADDTSPTGRLDVAVRLTGVVEEAAYMRWLETGAPPEGYCGDVWGTGHETYDHDAHEAARAERRTADVYDPTEPQPPTALVAAQNDVATGRVTTPHFRIRWDACPLRDCGFARWLRGPRVRAMAETYGADNVRVLVGFDS